MNVEMTWHVTVEEFDHVIHLPPVQRYEYFIKKVADQRELWSLYRDGWVLMGDNNGNETVPVWPHQLFAEAAAVGDWQNYQPRKIDLEHWLTKWTPGMEEDNRLVAIFPTEGKTTTATPAKLKTDLEVELKQYE